MIRHLFATTALAVALGGAAWAQEAGSVAPVEEALDSAEQAVDSAKEAVETAQETLEGAEEPIIVEGTEAAEGAEPMPAEGTTTAEGAEEPVIDEGTEAAEGTEPDPETDTMTVEGAEGPAIEGTEAAEGIEPMPEGDATTVQETVEPMVPGEAPADDGTLTADPVADPALAPVLVPVDIAELTVEDLVGASLRNPGGETLGSIDDALLDDAGQIEALVVSFGGFLGFGERTVEVALDEVTLMRDEAGTVIAETSMTPETLEVLPDYEAAPEG